MAEAMPLRDDPRSTALVRRAQEGDELAFSDLFLSHVDRCYAIAYRILRDAEQAEDAVQAAMTLAWRDLPQLRDAERFEAWLRRLLVNQCYRHAGRRRRWTTQVRELEVDHAAPGDAYLAVDNRDALDQAFRTLSPEQRAVFVLHHHVGLPLAELADTLGVPIGTVKSRLHYATQGLRDALDEAALDRSGSA